MSRSLPSCPVQSHAIYLDFVRLVPACLEPVCPTLCVWTLLGGLYGSKWIYKKYFSQ